MDTLSADCHLYIFVVKSLMNYEAGPLWSNNVKDKAKEMTSFTLTYSGLSNLFVSWFVLHWGLSIMQSWFIQVSGGNLTIYILQTIRAKFSHIQTELPKTPDSGPDIWSLYDYHYKLLYEGECYTRFVGQDQLNRLCHKTAPMPIHLYVLIVFGMGLVVYRRVHRAHNFGNFCVPKFGK